MIFNKFTKKNLSADGERVHCAHKLLMSTHTKTNTKPYVISSISRYFKSLNDKLNLKKETFFFANQRTSCQRPRRPYTGTVRATHSLTHDDRYIVLPHPSKKKRIFLFWVGPILPLFFFKSISPLEKKKRIGHSIQISFFFLSPPIGSA